jgi:GntR family transcriptional regulator / MocR family aminotransferase
MALHVEFAAGAPLRRQLEQQLRDAIRSGRLRLGTQLPASRILAQVPPGLLRDVGRQYAATFASPPIIEQAAAASFFANGDLDRHLRGTRRIYRARRDALVTALAEYLPQVRVGGAAAGLHLLAWLPEHADEAAMGDAARRGGVAVHELHRHCTSVAPTPPALLLGYGQLGEQALATGVRELAAVVS